MSAGAQSEVKLMSAGVLIWGNMVSTVSLPVYNEGFSSIGSSTEVTHLVI